MILRGAAVTLAALLSGAVGTGCSLEVELEPFERDLPEAVELLEFEAPHEGLVFSAADDEQPALEGVALTARVLVRDLENNLWLEDIELQAREVQSGDGEGAPAYAPVHVDRHGRRCAEVAFTFFPGERPKTYEIVARAGEGLEVVSRELTIAAAR
jgi:hypothetical protein